MFNICQETMGNFSKEELLKIVKEELDKLDIKYEDKPGGFKGIFVLEKE